MQKLQADATTEPKTKARPRGRKPSTPTLRDRLAAFFAAPHEIHATALATLLDVETDEVVQIADVPGFDLRDERGMVSAEDAVFIAGMLTPPSLLAEVGLGHRRTTAVTLFANAAQVAAFRELHNKLREHAPRSWRARLSFEDFLSDQLDSSNLGGDGNTVIESIHEQIDELERSETAKRGAPAQGHAHEVGADEAAIFYVRLEKLTPGESQAIEWHRGSPHGIERPAMVLHIRCDDHEKFMDQLLAAVVARDAAAIAYIVRRSSVKPAKPEVFVSDLIAALADKSLCSAIATAFQQAAYAGR